MPSTIESFAAFEEGKLLVPGREHDFAALPWNPHPVFPGVALKHLVTAADSGGRFSYHLVRIDPGMAIDDHVHAKQLETHEVLAGEGVCVNGGARLAYRPGVLSIFETGVTHRVEAGPDGLRLLAKFLPALC